MFALYHLTKTQLAFLFLRDFIMSIIIQGVGVNEGKYKTYNGWVETKEYRKWKSMLGRVYSLVTHNLHPTYIGCEVSESFKSFSYFHEWCNRQHGFKLDGWELDKDLLIKGNKFYSENTCVFIPKEINTVLVSNKARRGCCPLGVHFDKSKGSYRASISTYGKLRHLGRFKTKEQAFLAYKQAKEAYLSYLAERYKLLLDPRAYHALKNYQVEITD